MNNLEWLYENDRDALADFAECDECETCRAFDYCHGEHHDRGWLMAEHVGATCDNSGGFVTYAKSAKRTAAAERLREGKSDNIEWMILGDDCPNWVNYDTLSYYKAVRERIADLLEDGTTDLIVYNEASDDELFRCSYCHCKVYNIDMTEGDCGWGFTFCPQCGGEVYESDACKIEAELGEQWHDTLIDLLTDDDAHSKAHSKTEPLLTEQSESLSDEADSREKLEEIAWQYDASYAEPYEHGAIAEAIIELLDRQAAITERYWTEIVGASANANIELKRQIDELQAKVDELTEQLRESNAERERLRGCLGIATDHAHDFLTLVDESGNVYDYDEGLA